MAKFCGNCGSPLHEAQLFCGACGTKIPVAVATPQALPPVALDPAPWTPDPLTEALPPLTNPDPSAWAQVPAAYTPPPAAAPPPAAFTPAPASTYVPPSTSYAATPAAYTPGAAYPARKSNTLLKVVIAVVILICVGSVLALAALYYAAQKVTQKVHQAAAQALNGTNSSKSGGLSGLLGTSSSGDDSPGGFKGDPCRFLSKTDVSRAIGVAVIRAEAQGAECRYIANGDPADATSKHMASMLGGMGADAQTQKTIQKMAGTFFAQQQASDKDLSAEAATGEIPVLVVSLTSGHAATEMKLNRGALERLGDGSPTSGSNGQAAHTASGDLTGIGDEAYVAGGSMILVRKGNTLARFMYASCPCNTSNVEPLARELAGQL